MDNYNLELNVPSIETNINQTLIEIELPGGARGVKGDTGPQGPKGDKGDKGEKGNSGVWTGEETPPSDYDVWVIPDGTGSTIPTKTSELINDSGFIDEELDPVFSASAASGITSSDITNWNSKTSFSGDYDDLTNKPTIPKVNNALLTIKRNGSIVNTFSSNASVATVADIAVPTKTSDLTNDSGYITNSADNLTNYTTTTNLTTLLGNKQNTVLSGTAAPTSSDGEDGDIYLQYSA